MDLVLRAHSRPDHRGGGQRPAGHLRPAALPGPTRHVLDPDARAGRAPGQQPARGRRGRLGRAAPRQSLGRPRPGLLRGRNDRGAHRRPRPDRRSARDLANVDHAVQGSANVRAAGGAGAGGGPGRRSLMAPPVELGGPEGPPLHSPGVAGLWSRRVGFGPVGVAPVRALSHHRGNRNGTVSLRSGSPAVRIVITSRPSSNHVR
jgi:hypothetical protein